MDKPNFIVYKLTNIVNNKIYVGGTSEPLDVRFHGHVIKAKSGSNYPLHKALREYGEEAFSKIIIEECDSLEQLNERENYWIATLSATNSEIGYNSKAGGGIRFQSLESRRKIGNIHRGKISEKRIEILQYSSDGYFIKEYPSLTEAADDNNIARSSIIRSLRKGYNRPSKKNPYIWVYKKDLPEVVLKINPEDYFSNLEYKPQLSEECLSKRNTFNGEVFKTATPVAQYTLDGKLIKKYFSLSDASRQTGVSTTNIRAFLKDPDHYNKIKRKDRTKYIWKACDKNDPDVFKSEEDIRKMSAVKHTKIVKGYDENGNLIKEYHGIRKFENTEHIDSRTLIWYINEDAPYRGIYWKIE